MVKLGPQKILLSVRWLLGRSSGQRKAEPSRPQASINPRTGHQAESFRPPGRGHVFSDGLVRECVKLVGNAFSTTSTRSHGQGPECFPSVGGQVQVDPVKPAESEGLCFVPVKPLSCHQYKVYDVIGLLASL